MGSLHEISLFFVLPTDVEIILMTRFHDPIVTILGPKFMEWTEVFPVGYSHHNYQKKKQLVSSTISFTMIKSRYGIKMCRILGV